MEVCKFCCPGSLEELPKGLPNDTKYILCENRRPLIGSLIEGSFSVVLRTACSSVEDALKWLKDYSTESRTVWRVQCAHPESGRKNIFKTEYRCQHNTRHKRSDSAKRKPSLILKNTDCPAKLTIIVKRVPKRSRSSDKHLPQYPMVIQLKNEHNHSSNCLAALRHRDVNPDVRLKFETLYKEQKHSPGSALATHIHDLHQEKGDEVFEALSDRARCPDRGWCYSLYYKIFNKQYQDKLSDNKVEFFESALKKYNADLKSDCSRFSAVESNDFACAIITPLMRRNHQLNPNAKGVCVIDSSVRPEKDKTSIGVHLLFCDSDAGGLPLGLLIASSEEDNVLLEACTLYQSLLDSTSHFGHGKEGPMAFLSDDCPGLRNSLAAVFPSAEVLISVVHLTLGVWRVVCSQNCGIPVVKRPQMMQIGKRLLWAKSPEELQAACCEVETGCPELSQQFGRYQEYLREVHSVRNIWSPVLFSNSETRKMALKSTSIARDVIVQRIVSYGLLQMAHFIFTRLDDYYGRRVQDIVNDRETEATKRRFLVGKYLIEAKNITQVGPDNYRVVDGTRLVQEVDSSIGTCTCSVLNTSSALCKHQFAVLFHFGKNAFAEEAQPTPLSPSSKLCLYEIATNLKIGVPSDWFGTKNSSEIDEVEDSSMPETFADENVNKSADVFAKFSDVCDKMKEKLKNNPVMFEAAASAFCYNFNSMDDAQLLRALETFGSKSVQL